MPSPSRTGSAGGAGSARSADSAGGEAGFTLVELLVVLSLIGLLTMAAPALISAARPGVSAKTAAQSLAGELRAARQAAVATGQRKDVVFEPVARAYRSDGRTQALPAGLALDIAGADRTGIRASTIISFFADGSASGGRIRVGSDRSASWVSVNWLSGKVAVDDE